MFLYPLQDLHFNGACVSLANFPWMEPLVLREIRRSDAGKGIVLLHSTTLGLIRERINSQQPPKVIRVSNQYNNQGCT